MLYNIRSFPTVVVCINVFIIVADLPDPPKFIPNPFIFFEYGDSNVTCESREGKPSAAIKLVVTSRVGMVRTSAGNISASLELPTPLINWHNATAVCTVTNHNSSTLISESMVNIFSK